MLCGIDVYVGMYVCRYVCLIVAIRHESVEPLILVIDHDMLMVFPKRNISYFCDVYDELIFNKSTSRCRGKEIF